MEDQGHAWHNKLQAMSKCAKPAAVHQKMSAYNYPSNINYRTFMNCTMYHTHANTSLTFLMNANPNNPIYVRI